MVLYNISNRFSSCLWEKTYLVTLIDQLMGTSNEFQAIDMVELSCDLITEEPASAARGDGPSLNVLGIAPDEITERTLMRNLLCTSYDTDLVDGANFRAETTMNTENLAVDDSSKDQEVEYLATGLPDRSVTVLLLTLLVETVDLSDLAGLMVATNESNLIGIP